MDLGSTITALVIVLVCIIPFIIMGIKNRKKKQQFFKALLDLAHENSYSISRHEIWADTAIGIDDKAAVLFFTKKTGGSQMREQVSLSAIQECRLIKRGVTEGKTDNYTTIDMLGLGFTYHNKSKEDTVFEFYSSNESTPTLSGELDLAKHWQKISNDKIAGLQQGKK